MHLNDRDFSSLTRATLRDTYSATEAYDDNTEQFGWHGLALRIADPKLNCLRDDVFYYDSAADRDKDLRTISQAIERSQKKAASRSL